MLLLQEPGHGLHYWEDKMKRMFLSIVVNGESSKHFFRKKSRSNKIVSISPHIRPN